MGWAGGYSNSFFGAASRVLIGTHSTNREYEGGEKEGWVGHLELSKIPRNVCMYINELKKMFVGADIGVSGMISKKSSSLLLVSSDQCFALLPCFVGFLLMARTRFREFSILLIGVQIYASTPSA